jgi:hypothetical protein
MAPSLFGADKRHTPASVSAQHYHKYMPIWLLLGISAVGVPTIAQAEVHIDGTVAAVHVTTNKDAISDVLSAFETPFNLRYHTSVPLNGNVSSEYSGSLAYVISRLLGGYDYVITHDQGTIEIVVSGKHSEASAPVQNPVTAPGPQGPRMSDVSVDPRTYSACMALFRNTTDCAEMMKRLKASAP